MLRRILILPAAIAVPLLLAGCTPVDTAFGETHRWNIEQQVVDPDPQYAGEMVEGGSGQRAADAVTRYNEGQVTRPVSTSTTEVSTGSGAAAAGGPQ
jgi:hypothetical protein